MRRPLRVTASVAVLAAVGVAVVPSVVAAQSVTGELIRRLNRQLLYLAVPIAVLVESILFYAVWRFRGSDEPQPTRKNRELEITWTAATALVLLFVGTASFAVLAHPLVSSLPPSHGHGHSHGVGPGQAPPEAVEVVAVTEQWNYTFRYPDADVTTGEALVLPRNRTVYLYTTSRDVLHSVHVPALGLKQDSFPGQYNLIRTRTTETGSYRLYCAEYCGEYHARMTSTVRVVSPSEYDAWLESRGNATANETASAAPLGARPHP